MSSGLVQDDPDCKDVIYIEPKPFDVHCPEAIMEGLNAYKASCVARLSDAKVPICCRRCTTGHEIIEKFGIKVKGYSFRCDCGRMTNTGYKTCQLCRERNKRAKDKNKKKNNKLVRKCSECDNPATSQIHRYCDSCREKADIAAKERERLRIHKRIEREKAKLAELEV